MAGKGGKRRGGRITQMLLALGLALMALVAARAPVSAHSNFLGSEPSDSSALSQSPPTVSLDFDKRVSAALTTASLVDAEGRAHPVNSITVDPARNTRLVISLPPLPRDTYRLSFSNRDNDDLHLTKGSVVFAVGTAPTLSSQGQSFGDVRPLEVVLRWLGVAGIAAAVGGLILLLGVLPRTLGLAAAAAVLRRRLRVLVLAGAAAAVVAQALLLVAQAAELGDLGSGLSTLLTQSDYGLRWGLQTAALVGLLAVGAMLNRRDAPSAVGSRSGRLLTAAAAALALVATLTDALSGHSGDTSPTLGNTLFRSAHLLAVDVWVGGLIGLVLILTTLRRLPAEEVPARAMRNLITGFSRWAAPAFAVIVVTGLVLAGVEVATVTALLSTTYGLILIAKILLVAGGSVFAARHAWLLGRRGLAGGERGWLRRFRLSLPAEAGVAIFVVVLAAALASSPPARGPQFEPVADSAPSAVTANANDLVIRVSLRPNLPGRNILSVDVLNTRRPIPGPIRGVTIRLLAPGDTTARLVSAVPSLEPQTYDGGSVSLQSAGELKISVAVDRGGLPQTRADLPWSVNPNRPPPHPTVVSSLPVAPISDGLAVLLALVALRFFIRNRRRRLGDASAEPASPEPSAGEDLDVVVEPERPKLAVLAGSEVR